MAVKVVILTIGFRPNIGGLETHLSDLTDEISKQHDLLVVTLPPITTNIESKVYEKKGKLTIWRIPWFGKTLFYRLLKFPVLEFFYLTPPLFFGLFLALIKYPSIETIHAQGLSGLLTAAILGKVFRKKVIVSTHYTYGFKNDFFSKFAVWVYGMADRILCISNDSRQEMEEAGIDPQKLGRCAYWVNMDNFKPSDKKKAKGTLNWADKFSVFFIGRLVEVKGLLPLLGAISRIPENIHIYIAGDGPLKDKVAESANNHKNVHYLGKINNADTPIYFNAADVVVVPSLQETLGRVAMEALACATPVIASGTPGIKEVVNSKVGILIDPDSSQIATAIAKLFRDKKLYSYLQDNARTHIKEHYSEKNVIFFLKEYGFA